MGIHYWPAPTLSAPRTNPKPLLCYPILKEPVSYLYQANYPGTLPLLKAQCRALTGLDTYSGSGLALTQPPSVFLPLAHHHSSVMHGDSKDPLPKGKGIRQVSQCQQDALDPSYIYHQPERGLQSDETDP